LGFDCLRSSPHNWLRETDANGFRAGQPRADAEGTWDEVVNITDEYSEKQGRHPTVFVMKERKPKVLKNTGGFAPSGAALYWMIRHYWKHPQNRAELTDGRAIERLRNEQFVAE
jgi:hypothetical protein